MISDKLVYVPTTSPTNPTKTMAAFFSTMITFSIPLICFQYVNNWIRAGNTSPNAERHSAPNKEINNSRLGIATARRTEVKFRKCVRFFTIEFLKKIFLFTYMWPAPVRSRDFEKINKLWTQFKPSKTWRINLLVVFERCIHKTISWCSTRSVSPNNQSMWCRWQHSKLIHE